MTIKLFSCSGVVAAVLSRRFEYAPARGDTRLYTASALAREDTRPYTTQRGRYERSRLDKASLLQIEPVRHALDSVERAPISGHSFRRCAKDDQRNPVGKKASVIG